MTGSRDPRHGSRRKGKAPLEATDTAAALYHVVRPDEGFETAAGMLFELVRESERSYPGKPRTLFLDIEGHRNKEGGFDHDMFELQQNYVVGFLMPFLSEARLPLVTVKNSHPQRGDIPDELSIMPSNGAETTEAP
jgi:hypothetical protein